MKKLYTETKILLRSIPATVVTLFAVSVVCMNLLANKTLVQLDWIALDAGILISWLSFMCMDIITKHFRRLVVFCRHSENIDKSLLVLFAVLPLLVETLHRANARRFE